MIKNIPKKILIFTISVYKKTLSPDHGFVKNFFPNGACIYRPTCSEYTMESIKEFGAIRGSIKGFKRILRCHPFKEGGYDPVIKKQ
jgi:uncharacterized protein